MHSSPPGLNRPREFIAVCAFLMATIALAVDMMLPAMDVIASEFSLSESWEKPAMILGIFTGLMIGQWVFGPLSDHIGRKPSIQLGLAVFLIGTLVSAFAESYTVLILGRVIQGFGAASARIVTQAMIRDQFSGADMARTMSFVLTIFIFVPVIAPMLGQGLLYVVDWHWLFGILGLFASIMMIWVSTRLPETLKTPTPFSAEFMWKACKETFANQQSVRFMCAAGISFGGLLAYLSSVQQIFQTYYGVGDWFAPLFGATALSIAAASLLNAHIVRRFGMARISRISFTIQALWSSLFLGASLVSEQLSLIGWLVYVTPVLFFMGLTFSNLQAVAIQPLGHIAGTASTIIGSTMTALSLLVGFLFAQVFDGQVTPLIVTFLLTALTARGLIASRFEAQRL